jgi:hypothetical protein
MRYYEEMCSKYGFSYGDSIPAGIEHYRRVYVAAINRVAAKLGSNFRVIPYDRQGMHNWCLVVVIPKEMESGDPEDLGFIAQVENMPEYDGDDLLIEAVQVCHGMDLDSFVQTTVTVDMEGVMKCLDELPK